VKQTLTALFFLIAASLFPLDIRNESGLFLFDSEIVEFLNLNTMDDGTPYQFSNKAYNLVENCSISQSYSEMIGFDIGFKHDPILKSRFFTALVLHFSFMGMRVGPYFGMLNNSQTIINSGISFNINANISSFMFGSFTIESTLGNRIAETGDYTQDAMEIYLGTRLPFVIPRFTLNTATYTERMPQNAMMAVKRERYQVSLENRDRLWRFSLIRWLVGYQELSWIAYNGSRNAEYKLSSMYGGLELGFGLMPTLELQLKVELPFYTWVPTPITREPPGNILYYQSILGMTWSLDPRQF
jgi:hypothetical protein